MGVDPEAVFSLTEAVAARMSEAIRGDTSVSVRRSREDRERFDVQLGHWLVEEIGVVNARRLQAGESMLAAGDERELKVAVYAEIAGLGPIDVYMNDPLVEEIDVNDHLHTFVTYVDGSKVDVGQLWGSVRQLLAFQARVVLSMGLSEARLDEEHPTVTLQAPNGSRVVMVLGSSHRNGLSTSPRIAIRRFVVNHVGLAGLADRGMFPQWLVPQLEALVQAGMTMLISGGPGAGKTTLLKELIGAVPASERIVTIETALMELALEHDPRHPDVVALHTRDANTEGKGAVRAVALVEITRRLNPDRVIISELIEDEALEMLDVASMCKRGSMATIHAQTVEQVLGRLVFYIAKSKTVLPEFAVWELIGQTIDFVIHIDMVRNAGDATTRRRVTAIEEFAGRNLDGGGVRRTKVWGVNPFGEFVQQHPLEARHLERLQLAGISPELFTPNATVHS